MTSLRLEAHRPKASHCNDARDIAWVAVLKFLDQYLGRMTAHTRFNILEGSPNPNYLTIDFPRTLAGAALHECGVYAVRMAYILLSMARNIDRVFKGSFDMRARWILLPLHVGLILESRSVALLIVHNQSLFVVPPDNLHEREIEWQTVPPGERDPTDPNELRIKFLEDVAASVFLNDVDMPVLSHSILGPSVPVSTKSIWDSYQKHVVPNYKKTFSPFVASKRKPEYQFDLKYLETSSLQKHWFNQAVVPFWNTVCKKIFMDRQKQLVADIDKNKDEYIAALNAAIDALLDSYDKDVFPEKAELSKALRDDPKLLPPGRRAVFAERQEDSARDVAEITRVRTH